MVWTVLVYVAEGWTLTKADEKRIESAELLIYRRMLPITLTEHRTDQRIPTEVNTTRQLLGFVLWRKLSFFGHIIRNDGFELVKCVILAKVNGKRQHGKPNIQYEPNKLLFFFLKCYHNSLYWVLFMLSMASSEEGYCSVYPWRPAKNQDGRSLRRNLRFTFDSVYCLLCQ